MFREGTGAKLLRVIPFTSAVKYSAVVLEKGAYVQVRQSLYSGRIIPNMRQKFQNLQGVDYRVLVLEVMMQSPTGSR